ncbi:MAG: hypothetical protein AB7V46_21800 [Thermomicrobiales bacterium]
MTDTIRIYVETVGPGRFNARFASPDGEVLVTSSREPALAAARALIGRGFSPASILEMWDSERPYARLRGVLDVMAGQTVIEASAGSGLRFGKYVAPPSASQSCMPSPKIGIQGPPATPVAPDADGPVRENPESDADLSGEASP